MELSETERAELERWAGGGRGKRLAVRAKAVLACADGLTDQQAGERAGCGYAVAGKWRARFQADRLDGLREAPRPGRPKAGFALSGGERDRLERWARRRNSSQALALRSRIVLACAGGLSNKRAAAELGCSEATVGKWRSRFAESGLDGLVDEDRPGRPRTVTVDQVEDVVVATLEETPKNATHWSRKKMAERSGLSKSTIGRIWRAFGLKPHREDGFKMSNDPLFIEKVYDVVGLYLDPPESAVVLCVDEKSQVQALARSQPAFPMMPGMAEKRTHDYVRHGTTSLFAAFDTQTGEVISSIHRRHRSQEFRKFLAKIDGQVPAGLDMHIICDNYGTHKSPAIQTWLKNHPRFQVHFTPTYSSWLNQVERFFGFVTQDLLQRSDHRSVQALERDIREWVKGWNENPRPFIWTKTAEQILNSIAKLLERIKDAGH
ncbi:MAG: IS630 family transposase [Bifidobacteriaceae bacterium]|nr:IS630 family transposase [Bifidobacteriaceae bacterium]